MLLTWAIKLAKKNTHLRSWAKCFPESYNKLGLTTSSNYGVCDMYLYYAPYIRDAKYMYINFSWCTIHLWICHSTVTTAFLRQQQTTDQTKWEKANCQANPQGGEFILKISSVAGWTVSTDIDVCYWGCWGYWCRNGLITRRCSPLITYVHKETKQTKH